MRGVPEKSETPPRGGTPWRARSPGELRAVRRPKPPTPSSGFSRGGRPCRRGCSFGPSLGQSNPAASAARARPPRRSAFERDRLRLRPGQRLPMPGTGAAIRRPRAGEGRTEWPSGRSILRLRKPYAVPATMPSGFLPVRDGSERPSNVRRGTSGRSELRSAPREEKSSEGRNPRSGSGMKQGRQARGG
jgi:hypothetical protein